MDILQLIGEYLSSLIDNPVVGQLVSGAIEGVVIGLIVGAIVWAVMQAPDTMGRGILFAIILGIVVVIWEFAKIGATIQGSVITALNKNPAMGGMFLEAGIHTLTAMLIGAALGVGMQVPHFMIRGGIIGLFLGALVGAALRFGLTFYGVSLSLLIFRGLVTLGVWALVVTFSGK